MAREYKSRLVEVIPESVTSYNRRAYKISKQWKIAARKTTCKQLNEELEYTYHYLITRAKELFATLPDDYSRTYLERDYKNDITTPLAIHLFQTAWFSIHLRCELALWYTIQYDFYCCPFEQELIKIIELETRCYPTHILRCRIMPSIEYVFRRRLFSEDSQFIETLEYSERLVT